jgi:hypothetical protein
MEIRETVITAGTDFDEVRPWPVSWSAIIVGALSSLAAITVFGLYGTAIGISSIAGIQDFSTWHEVTLGALVSAICGVFFAYVIGGWVAGKITGARLSEPTILHGAISWLATIPALLILLSIGAGKTFGGWYGGIMSTMSSSAVTNAATSPLVARHTATAAATSLLVGLIGSVIGGWMASGEPMSLTHHKTRAKNSRPRP